LTPAPSAHPLASPAPPWVHLLAGAGGAAALPPAPPGFAVRTLDGRRCQTKPTLLDELARVLQFPAHFGKTWDALEDCLTDLDWLPHAGYWLFITSAHRLLARDDASYATFVELLEAVGRAWATGATGHPGRTAVPFHTVLVVPVDRLSARSSWGAPRLPG
jgi:hypothetical protein